MLMFNKRTFRLSFLILLILAASLHTTPGSAATSLDFTSVTPTRVQFGSRAADYARDLRGYGWDFDNDQQYAKELTRTSFVDGGSVTGGMFTGVTAHGDPKIWLQAYTIPGTIPTPNEGATAPIPTNRYRYLTFRMFASEADAAIVFWHRDGSSAPGSFGGAGFKTVRAGWHTYSFDLIADRNAGAGSLAWNAGPIQTIAIKPANKAGVRIMLDYVRLSGVAPTTGPAVTGRWPSATSNVNVFFDTRSNGANATLIRENVSGSEFRWNTPNLAPGTYYLITRSGSSTGSSPPFTINTPPQGQMLAPSTTSGPDYATTVVGNPWDMNDSADIKRQYNIIGGTFRNGIFTGTNRTGNTNPNLDGDPGLELNVTTPIDPARFYYLTYRMRLLGPQDIFAGSVLRLLWWTGADLTTSASTTKDVVIYEGWQTVSIDLRTALLEPDSRGPWRSGHKVGFRLDPHEFPTPRTFELDEVKLTGNDRASTTFPIRYTVTDANNDPVRVSFFSTTQRTGENGQAIRCAGSVGASPGPHKVFLPLVTNRASGVSDEKTCMWDVRQVPNGDYYIYMVADDGFDTTTVISETPVEVRR